MTSRALLSPRTPNGLRSRAARRGIALLVAVGLGASGATLLPAAANGATPSFATSFESADPAPLVNTPLTESTTVTGSSLPPGSLLGHVVKVSADHDNPPNEVAVNLVDGNASTKWLSFNTTGVITYQLDAPETMKVYSLTSGGDAPERDPKDFTIQGSTDGQNWTTVDQQSNQSFSDRGVTNTYTAATPGAYSWYRLSITANQGGQALTQLADWSISDGTTDAPPASPMVTTVGNGPVSGPNIKSTVGFTGAHALRYAGSHRVAGAASATNVLYQDLSLSVTADSQLSYTIFPESGGDTSYAATFAAIDLQLSDGSLVSANANVTDQNGNPISARAQGDGKVLFTDQWNSVKIRLGALAGKTVTKVLFTYDNDTASATTKTHFQGWIDDIRIGDAPRIDGSSLVNYVDTRRGTNSSGSFSRGNNIPAAAVPNGFNFWTPMTDASSESWEYMWQQQNDGANLPMLQGLGVSHEPSPWMGDRDQLAIMPSTTAGGTAPDATLSKRAQEFDHANEVARPDLYSVKMTNGMVAEVTPSDHGAVLRFQFPSTSGSVLFDGVGQDEQSSITVNADGTVSGWTQGGSGLSVGATRMFFSGTFDTTPTSVGTAAGNRSAAKYVSFGDLGGDRVVELRMATSFISLDQAKHNADLEITGKSFDAVQQSAAAAWNARLGVITVPAADATDSQLQSLYGSLYRMNMYPNSQFENTCTAAAPAMKYASPNLPTTGAASATTTNAVVKSGQVYVNNGFWDTYRTVWPLYSALYPKVAQQLVDGFVQQYRDGGWTPRWSSPGYADLMTGTSSDVAFANAYIAGAVDTKTALDAFDAGFKNATTVSTSISGAGRKALDQSIFLGYVPASLGESVSWGLEGSINDYGLGQMAAKLAADPATPKTRVDELKTDASYLLQRSQQYVNLFDPSTGFFQGRNADGSFQVPAANFDPASWGGAFTETDGWNFAFHAPFDVQGLAGLYGGDAQLIQKLQQFYSTPETGKDYGSYGGQIHEMAEAASVRIGQLGMSNQPSHHIPYIAAAAGDPSLTQSVVREATRRLFTGNDIGEGYVGDEDNGEMSSWFVFSALGFYPLAQGSGQYTIGSPLFAHATVHLPSGKSLTITAANNNAKNVYIQSASFNGKALDRATIPVADVAKGGALNFTMGAKPSTWGNGKTQGAAGADAPAKAPTPLVDATKAGFGTTSSSDGTPTTSLTDDESLTATTFSSATPQVTWQSAQGPVTVTSYTLTTAATGAQPTAWTLEGSSDGKTWVKLSTVAKAGFDQPLQTRPFLIAKPSSLAYYRLSVTGTSTGAAPSIAELELLTDTTATAKAFTLSAAPGLTAQVGQKFTAPVASVSGPNAASAAVTIDWNDGQGPQPVTLTKSALGAYQVAAPHTFAKAGAYPVHVVAKSGTAMQSVDVTVQVSRTAPTLTGAFDNVCLGDAGQSANCDFESNGFSRPKLAADGFVQGQTNPVTGTDMSFDLPAVTPGQPDNATGNGRTIPVPQGTGITELSVIGTATEGAQQTKGTIAYADGTTGPFEIDLGDWTAQATTPLYGDTIVAKSAGRTHGATGTDGTTAAIYATPAFAIPAGKRPVSITLPLQTASSSNAPIRIHVFAIATNGSRFADVPLTAKPGAALSGVAESPVQGTLATATGGQVAAGAVTATVNWGDGSPLTDATVAVANGTATVTGSHAYAAAGTYTATTTVDDGVGSVATTTTVTVAKNPFYLPRLSASLFGAPGKPLHVTGSGFAPLDQVTIKLDGKATGATVTTTATGTIAFDVTMPKGIGVHVVEADGAVTRFPAVALVVVAPIFGSLSGLGSAAPATSPEFRVFDQVATEGTVVAYSGNGYQPGQQVQLTLHSTPVSLGTVTANGDGVIAGTVTIPTGAPVEQHHIIASTAASTISVPFTVTDHPAAAMAPAGTAASGSGTKAGRVPTTTGTWTGLSDAGVTSRTAPLGIATPASVLAVAALLLGAGSLIAGAGWAVRRRRFGR